MLPLTALAVDANGNLIFSGADPNGYVIADVPRVSVNFGSTPVCVPGSSTPCDVSKTVRITPRDSSAPGARVVTSSAASSPDFTVTNLGTTLTVTFMLAFAGTRTAQLQILDANDVVQSSTLLYGAATGAQVAYPAVQSTVTPSSVHSTSPPMKLATSMPQPSTVLRSRNSWRPTESPSIRSARRSPIRLEWLWTGSEMYSLAPVAE